MVISILIDLFRLFCQVLLCKFICRNVFLPLQCSHSDTHAWLGSQNESRKGCSWRSCRGIISFIAPDSFYLLFLKHLSWGGSLAYRRLKFCYVCYSRRLAFLPALLPHPTPHFTLTSWEELWVWNQKAWFLVSLLLN